MSFSFQVKAKKTPFQARWLWGHPACLQATLQAGRLHSAPAWPSRTAMGCYATQQRLGGRLSHAGCAGVGDGHRPVLPLPPAGSPAVVQCLLRMCVMLTCAL